MINIGAYKAGSNPNIDYAISKIDEINKFLMQNVDEKFEFDTILKELQNIFAE